MGKLLKKSMAVLLAMLTMISIFAIAVPPEGGGAGWMMEAEAAGNTTLAELMEKFPHGKYWNHVGGSNNPDGYTSSPCTHHKDCGYYANNCECNSYLNAIQCHGFAIKLAYDYYGSNLRNWDVVYNLDSVKPGDAIRYKYDGHTIWVTGVNGDVITYADCNSDGKCKIRWNQTINKADIWGLTKVYVAPEKLSDSSTPAPTYANISASASNIAVGSSISLYADSDNATSYKFWISDASTWDVVKEIKSNQSSVSVSGLPKGKYHAYVTAINSQGSIDSKGVYFYVVSAPTSATCSVSKATYGLGENVSLTFSANETVSKYNVIISSRASWEVVRKVSVTDDTSYSTANLPAGEYNAYVTAVNAAGYVDSNHVNFTVTDQLEAALTVSKAEYSVGDAVDFSFTSNLGGKYKIWISDADNWELLHTATVNSSTYSINTLPNGNYCAYVTAMNDSGYYVDSNQVYFSIGSDAWVNIWQKSTAYAVGETCTFSFDSNLNGTYKVWISDTSDWSLVHTSGQISDTTYSISTLPEGSYAAYVTAINDYLQVDSALVHFTVTQKDNWSSLYVNRKEFLPGENMEFEFASSFANSYTLWISDVSDWSVVRKITVNGTSYIINDLPVGQYCAYTSAYDSSNTVDSASVYFKVSSAPTTVSISANRNTVTPEDDVTFSFTSDTAVNYKLWITDTTTWDIYYSGVVDGNSYTTKLPAGIYSVYVTAYNRAGSVDSDAVMVGSVAAIDNVELVVSSSLYYIGETVEFEATYIPNAEYVLALTNITEDTVTAMEVDSYSFSVNDLPAGDYTAFVTAENSVSSVSSEEVFFSVASALTSISVEHASRVSTVEDIEVRITTDCTSECTYDVIVNDSEGNFVTMTTSNTPSCSLGYLAAGEYEISVCAYNGFTSVESTHSSITVYSSEVALDITELELKVGESYTFTPTVTPEDTEDTLYWFVDVPEESEPIASIDSNGTVTAMNAGEISVVAVIGDFYAICTLTVTNPATAIELDKPALSLQVGESDTLTATVTPENSTDSVVWSSSDNSIVIVDENGTVTAIAPGTCTITATAGEVSAICTITVKSTAKFAAPTNLYAYTFGYTSIKMTWDAVEGADGYEIFRCDRAGQPYYYIDEVSADETAYRNIGLSTGTTYYYKVRAFVNLEDGTKLYSDLSAYSSARPLPATPVVTVTRTSATTATVSWVKIYGATGYSVYRSTEENGTYTFVANLKSGDTTSYKATGLASTTTYYYKVRAYRQMGSDMMFGSYSKAAAALGAPATPVITARSVGYTSAKVVWEPVENADGYAIYRCDVGGGSYSYVASVGADVTSYTNTGLSTGTTYYYKVRAYMNVGSGKLYSNYSACATARPIPATPVVTVTADTATTAIVSWVKIYGATGYSVYRSTEKDGTYTFLAGISSGDTVSYTDKNLDEGVTYYYKVRAYRQMGSDMMFSNYSLPVCAD